MGRSWKEDARFGSARFARDEDLRRAGMLRGSGSAVFLGFTDTMQPIFYEDDGGLITVAGARTGKLRDVLAYNICTGLCREMSLLILDVKGELAAISQDQTPDGKHCWYWNPLGLHGLPRHRLNPVGHLKRSSPTLLSDVKVFAEQWQQRSGAANALYFELSARRILEAVCLILIHLNGVLGLPDLYAAIGAQAANDDEWRDLAWEMHRCGIDLCRRVEAEIASAREDGSGGFRGILGEMLKSVSCLSDPLIRDSVSPPYDIDLEDLCKARPAVQFYIMTPPEMIEPWAPVIKSLFAGAMLLKSRAPQAPRQTWILDECAQLGGFDLVVKMFSFGAGIGIRPWAIFQQYDQMNALGPQARDIICASAAVQQVFGLRDWDSVRRVSDMLGVETLDYDDLAHHATLRQQIIALLRATLSGRDPFESGPELSRMLYEQRLATKLRRPLLTPDEVLNIAGDRQFIFADALPGAVFARRAPYWTQRFMAGRYHPNPYHPPLDRVGVMTRWGRRWRPVIVEPVPEAFAAYPQYRDGLWSHIGEIPL